MPTFDDVPDSLAVCESLWFSWVWIPDWARSRGYWYPSDKNRVAFIVPRHPRLADVTEDERERMLQRRYGVL